MWLLSAARAELHSFVSPEAVPDGYAILSHVWGDDEQSFRDVKKLEKRCAITGGTPRNFVCEKIRRCCEFAEEHGFKWVWIDTCCIDKSSSSELSEAINSMFSYYSHASICYAYLRDVPTPPPSCNLSIPFIDSRWHKRGWTLQELLAPRLVLFVSQTWDTIGSKADFAEDLEAITDIPSAVLRHEVELSHISIAQRMCWAAERETTRAEDEAYCLLGIFGINMPTLYGEGRKAFQRLQEEIMKRSADTTLFAWGPRCEIGALHGCSEGSKSGLLATAPSQFRCSTGLRYTPEASIAPPAHGPDNGADHSSIMTFSITPYGVLAHIPTVNIDDVLFADLCWSSGGQRLWLILASSDGNPHPAVPLFDIGGVERYRNDPVRIVTTPENSALCRRGQIQASWKDVYLTLHTPEPQPRFSIPMNNSLLTPIRIPERHLATLLDELNANIVAIANVQMPWTGSPPTKIAFRAKDMPYLVFVIRVGRCFDHEISTTSSQSSTSPSVWANIMKSSDVPRGHDGWHDPADHLVTWPGLRKQFEVEVAAGEEIAHSTFTLSFTRCPFSTGNTLVMDIRPDGPRDSYRT